MFLSLQHTAEGVGNERSFEFVLGWRRCWWYAGSGGEYVDEFENEEARECTAKVGNTTKLVSFMRLGGKINLRCKESHISATDDRICNLCVECACRNEHDGAHECGEDMATYDGDEISCGHS